ncbi:MAG: rRNA maturation RNase YbeY [Minisyncoccia bacterium]
MEETLSVINKTKGKLPSLPFDNLKNDILGKKFSCSIVFVGEKRSREFNKKYRGKDKSTNILSFCLSKTEGEMILCPAVAKREYKKFDRTYPNFIGFLVIHGMLHLKGMEHSSRMDKAEQKYDQKYFYRNRLGVLDDESRSGRIFKGRKKS